MLLDIPEIQDAERRPTSLILYFLCGLLKSKAALLLVIVKQFASRDDNIGLQCFAELESGDIVDSMTKDFFTHITLHGSQFNQYALLGLQRAIKSKSYQLTS